MTETLVVEPRTTSRAAVLVMWSLRVVVALLFLYVGIDKFSGARVWVRIFDAIGVGQWFRYLTGALQVGGATLVLVPRTSLLGIGILACTMLGACIAWLTVLHSPATMATPAALFVMLLAVGAFSWRARGIDVASSK